jgi:photosystem II stability/assembly factor-like uncharacterized protein
MFSTTLRRGVFAVDRSDDGGRTWRESAPFRDAHGQGAGAPVVVDARHLVVAVDEGAAAGSQAQALYASGDSGRTWRFVSRTDATGRRAGALPFGCDKRGFGFATPTRGWAGGYCAGGPPFLYRSDDGGRTWRRQRLGGVPQSCGCETSAPRFFTPASGALFVAGFASNGNGRPFVRVFWTTDGGAHWRGSSPRAGRTPGVSFANARSAWVAAQPPDNLRAPFDRLFVTADAGRHWRTAKLPFDAQGFQLDAVSANVAYATSGTAQIRRTVDGGRTWQTIVAR